MKLVFFCYEIEEQYMQMCIWTIMTHLAVIPAQLCLSFLSHSNKSRQKLARKRMWQGKIERNSWNNLNTEYMIQQSVETETSEFIQRCRSINLSTHWEIYTKTNNWFKMLMHPWLIVCHWPVKRVFWSDDSVIAASSMSIANQSIPTFSFECSKQC